MLSSALTDRDIILKAADKYRTSSTRRIFCDLSIKDFINLFRKGNGTCFYSGEEFENFSDMTLERLDPSIGYVKGNVVLVRGIYNNSKEPLDRYLKSDQVPDHVRIKIMQEAIKVCQRRIDKRIKVQAELITKAAAEEERKLRVTSMRAANLSEMAKNMPRSRFQSNNRPKKDDK